MIYYTATDNENSGKAHGTLTICMYCDILYCVLENYFGQGWNSELPQV